MVGIPCALDHIKFGNFETSFQVNSTHIKLYKHLFWIVGKKIITLQFEAIEDYFNITNHQIVHCTKNTG